MYLLPITKDNWKQCSKLSVADDQKDFVPSNLYSIAEAQFYAQARPLAIYNQTHEMVGFVLYGRDEFTNKWKIFRIMVDVAHQHKGYGRAALLHVINELARQPDSAEILICYHKTNFVARQLYSQLGFIEQSTDNDDRVTALLRQN